MNQKVQNSLFSANILSYIAQLHNETGKYNLNFLSILILKKLLVKDEFPGIRITVCQAPDGLGV